MVQISQAHVLGTQKLFCACAILMWSWKRLYYVVSRSCCFSFYLFYFYGIISIFAKTVHRNEIRNPRKAKFLVLSRKRKHIFPNNSKIFFFLFLFLKYYIYCKLIKNGYPYIGKVTFCTQYPPL